MEIKEFVKVTVEWIVEDTAQVQESICKLDGNVKPTSL